MADASPLPDAGFDTLYELPARCLINRRRSFRAMTDGQLRLVCACQGDRIAQRRVRFRREVGRTKNVFEANHIIQVGDEPDTSRLFEQQWACLRPPQADLPENKRICDVLKAMRYGLSLTRLGYFRNGWAIFHSGKSYPPVEAID